MQITSILFDNNGKIVGRDNILTLPCFKFIMSNLDIKLNQKKLLANADGKNYIIKKIQVELSNQIYEQFIVEEWRMVDVLTITNLKRQASKKHQVTNLFNYPTFTPLEQEVIYALLSGYGTSKEIEECLSQFGSALTGNIKYTLSILFKRFNTGNKTDLTRLLKLYDLDKHLPLSLFPSGVYDI